MAGVANNPAFAKKVGIPRSVGEEFMKADKGKALKKGAPKSMIKHEMKEAGMKKMAAGGSASKRADGIAAKGKTKGTMIKMRMGGKACK